MKIITPAFIEVSIISVTQKLNINISNKTIKLVNLAGISINGLDEKEIEFALNYLKKLILDKEVTLVCHYHNIDDKNEISAVIIKEDYNINFSLLKNGLVSYGMHEPYELDFWSRCHYKKAFQEARGKLSN